MLVVPPGQGGSPGGRSSSGGGGSGRAPTTGGNGFAGWEVKQTPNGPQVVGAVTSSGQLIPPGGVWPGTGGKRLIVPPGFNGQGPPNIGGGNPGAPGGGPPFVPPGSRSATSPNSIQTGGAGGASSLWTNKLGGVLSGMFPFISDLLGGAAGGGPGGAAAAGAAVSTGGAIEDFAGVFANIGSLLGQFLRGVEILFTPTFWVRAVCFLIGLPAVTYGLFQLGHARSGGATALGITAVGSGLVFLFLAFHNLPDTVNSPGSLATFLKQEIQGGSGVSLTAAAQPYTTASIMEPPLTPGTAATAAGP